MEQEKKARTIEEEEIKQAESGDEAEAQEEVIEEAEAELVDEDTEEADQVKELEVKVEELNQRLIRNQADYDNFRRRTRKEKEADAKYRAQSLAEKLIPALDNFERAMMVQVDSEDGKSLLQGMEMVYRQMKEALESEGIAAIETVGTPFDPHYHQAVAQAATDEYDSNVVVEEMQKGYMLKDRVIRPAMVKVNA
ncbi:nucleotide exchange factor GrpE [Alteribacter keqinensis]|uniref:Protein GrpE n=1 Tax=Alteribacter keqinensis TaxID=2483800 RepID=A0A3M7TVR2_9BACI|nr:nucleotide exchange factor GrpE [Alteribacter keqinensis]RNA68854.1 nucleotide exchange factor GrpE [Alteribacter keqinensis]